MASTRLNLGMSLEESIAAMSGGVIGASRVCADLVRDGSKVDPDAFGGTALAGVSNLLNLDSLGIYEHRIWMLYKDVCNEHLGKMIAVLRAWQMGQLGGATKEAIDHAIDHRGAGLDLDAIVKAVKKKLPRFNAEAVS